MRQTAIAGSQECLMRCFVNSKLRASSTKKSRKIADLTSISFHAPELSTMAIADEKQLAPEVCWYPGGSFAMQY